MEKRDFGIISEDVLHVVNNPSWRDYVSLPKNSMKLKEIKSFRINQAKIIDSDLALIRKSLPNIESLVFGELPEGLISFPVFKNKEIHKLTNLNSIEIASCGLNDNSLNFLKGHEGLSNLVIAYGPNSTAAICHKKILILKTLPSLKSLKINLGDLEISDGFVNGLKNLKTLKTVSIYGINKEKKQIDEIVAKLKEMGFVSFNIERVGERFNIESNKK